MERALRTFAIAFFFTLPVVFFPPAAFGTPAFSIFFGHPGSVSVFEGARLAYAVVWSAILAALAFFLRWRSLRLPKLSASVFATLALCFLFWLSSYSNPGFPLSDVIAWRTYSVLPFLSLALAAFSLAALSSADRKAALSAFVVWFVAANLPLSLFQSFASDPFFQTFSFPWEGSRAYGTLGNPNSLAFLSVLCLPVAFAAFPKGAVRKSLIVSLFAICVASLSWSGVAAFAGYLSYRYFGFLKTLAVTLAATFVFFAFSGEFQQKRMSLGTRFAIVGDVAARSVSNPKTFFLGDGAWAVEEWFSLHRSAEVTNFVDPRAPIDRAHFFFFDLALVFWTPFALALFFAAWRFSKKTERPVREALSVFLLLSCLHTPDVAHLSFLTLLLVSGLPVRKRPEPSVWTA